MVAAAALSEVVGSMMLPLVIPFVASIPIILGEAIRRDCGNDFHQTIRSIRRGFKRPIPQIARY